MAARLDRATAVPARLVGAGLALGVSAISRVRTAPKPLHPRGDYAHATLTRLGSTDVPGWLGTAGSTEAVVRLSRAVGFPDGWPDVRGVALRVDVEGREADLLFATTGLGRITRYLLTAATATDRRPYTTLLPYRGSEGSLILGLRPLGPASFLLLRADALGPWSTIGRLDLTSSYDGPALSFDPVLHPVPGLAPYAWVRALREPAYRTARRGRAVLHLGTTTTDLQESA